jgi:hypothetical protein
MTQHARVSNAAACAMLLLLLLLLLHPPPARTDASWQQFATVSAPAGVQKHQALSHAGAVVIIGGAKANGDALPHVYTLDSTGTWTQRSANLPLIWHSASTLQAPLAVVFGGIEASSGAYSNRTYSFDLSTYAFAEVRTAAAPSVRCLHAAAATSPTTMVLFGGLSPTGLPPPPAPPPRTIVSQTPQFDHAPSICL